MNPRDTSASERWRIFIAAWPDDAFLDALDVADRWLNRFRTHRIIPREQRHLTLAFLGDVELCVVAALTQRCAEMCKQLMPADAPIDGLLGIPSKHKARVVAVGLERRPELITLMERVLLTTAEVAPVETVLRDLDRERMPHVTVARTRRTEQARRLDFSAAPPCSGVMKVRNIRVIRSHLTDSGPQYEVLREFAIGAG